MLDLLCRAASLSAADSLTPKIMWRALTFASILKVDGDGDGPSEWRDYVRL